MELSRYWCNSKRIVSFHFRAITWDLFKSLLGYFFLLGKSEMAENEDVNIVVTHKV